MAGDSLRIGLHGAHQWKHLVTKVKELTKFLLDRQEGWITILGTLKDEAALVKVKVQSELRNNDINLKETLILLGYAQDYEQIRVGAHPSV